jgi:hypothetical protein
LSALLVSRSETGLPSLPNLHCGLPDALIHRAVGNGTITPYRLNDRTYLIPREQVERYRLDSLGQRGKRKKKPATEPAERGS